MNISNLDTPRLSLRKFTLADADALFAIHSDPTTMCFWPRPRTLEETIEWIERSMRSYEEHGFGRYLVTLKETGELIGDCGILSMTLNGMEVVDIGYILHHPWWGRGLASEAAAAVRDHAFEGLGLPTLHANMAYDHIASQRVAEKIGMTKVGEFMNERNRGIRTMLYIASRTSSSLVTRRSAS